MAQLKGIMEFEVILILRVVMVMHMEIVEGVVSRIKESLVGDDTQMVKNR